ncbi:MAG: SpoIID/LytB domain-containing protein [Snowella sp.]|nr:SpoIID/LytB domain-containing protein [Snowella sp.]
MQRNSVLFALAAVSLTLSSGFTAPVSANDIEIKVGVVQRFGDEAKDQLELTAPSGSTLTLRFVDQNNQPQTLTTQNANIGIVQQTLPAPKLEERLVLSEHSTFETAEDSANQWKALGLQVEVTQPERWQVWAKRDVYSSPLVRRWLLQSLKAKGYDLPRLDSAIVNAKPQTLINVNGKQYPTSFLEVSSTKNLVQVREGKNNPQRLYGGSLKLQPNAYGTYTLVNTVPLEVYLRGVVPHEIGSNAPENATKAQTIIARTYALRNLRRFEADNYQLCASTHCQVYYGLKDTSPKADKAIAETRGLVLTYQNELVDALYSSTTGGVTARFSDVWNGEERPYLQAVIDSPKNLWDLSQQSLENEADFRKFINLKDGFNESERRMFRWRYQNTLEELNRDLKTYLGKRKHPLANFTTIQSMQVTQRSPSGRILILEVQTDKGVIELAKNEARSAFSSPRSTLFYVDPIYDKQKQLTGYAFVGGGLGHGVGMSQFGSYKLAQLGWSPEKILAFYYRGAKLQPLNNSIVFWKGN